MVQELPKYSFRNKKKKKGGAAVEKPYISNYSLSLIFYSIINGVLNEQHTSNTGGGGEDHQKQHSRRSRRRGTLIWLLKRSLAHSIILGSFHTHLTDESSSPDGEGSCGSFFGTSSDFYEDTAGIFPHYDGCTDLKIKLWCEIRSELDFNQLIIVSGAISQFYDLIVGALE